MPDYKPLSRFCDIRQDLDIKVVSYNYETMRQNEEANLVVVVEVEACTRELGSNNTP
jgi:hypothetical protein